MKPIPVNTVRGAFSLIEMAAVLLLIGLMAGLLLRAQKTVNPASACTEQTRAQLTVIQNAIEAFGRNNGHYPLPANRSLGVADTYFGHEAIVANIDTIASGTIYAGALPFQALGLADSYAADCWGNKFSYFVTKALTDPGTLAGAEPGVIEIRSSLATQVLRDAAYAVVSHGQTARGAVAKNYTGVDHGWCAVGIALDTGNCDGGTISPSAGDGTLYAASFNDGENAGGLFFDDLIVFAAKKQSNCNDNYNVVWDVGVEHCSATVGPLANMATLGVDYTDPSTSGHATVKCTNGVLALDLSAGYYCSATVCGGGGGGMCGAACPTDIVTWGSGCSASFDGLPSGYVSPSTANTAPGYSGAATASCINGVWQPPSGTCSP